MLSVADHTYQVAKSDDNFTQYAISTAIVERASALFDADNSFDARQKGEIQSFYPGNKPEDTAGCILVGQEWSGGSWVGRSSPAFDALFAKINHALDSGLLVYLEIE